jgi:hypothetical protein
MLFKKLFRNNKPELINKDVLSAKAADSLQKLRLQPSIAQCSSEEQTAKIFYVVANRRNQSILKNTFWDRAYFIVAIVFTLITAVILTSNLNDWVQMVFIEKLSWVMRVDILALVFCCLWYRRYKLEVAENAEAIGILKLAKVSEISALSSSVHDLEKTYSAIENQVRRSILSLGRRDLAMRWLTLLV